MRVFVAMSGGVDSSVAAALLVEAGHDVTGVTMQLLPEGDAPGECCGEDTARSARRVCDTLGIPHFILNMREGFSARVVEPFAAEYARGRTPNPCIACNDRMKFSGLLGRVRTFGAEVLATGHYARVVSDSEGMRWLARGTDAEKDQSYFLYRLVPPALDAVLFPVGELHKSEVREKAAALGLPTAERADSQEVCFLGPGQLPRFVGDRYPDAIKSGPIIDVAGTVIGTHRGIARYTVGQRKGLGIASAEPLYVVGIDASRNSVIVGPRDALQAAALEAGDAVWRLGDAAGGPGLAAGSATGVRVTVQTRYRMRPVPATARHDSGRLTVALDDPIDSVAPGQAVVCYVSDRVVGGGVIECSS